MNSSIYICIVLVLIFAWYLSFSASRLDRLHHRVETSWEHLDSLLQRRAAIALEIAHLADIDPATRILLTNSAYQARGSELSEREDAERVLSESLKFLRESVVEGELSIKLSILDELATLTEKIRLAITIHLEAINAVSLVRAKMIFRFFHLAGRAKWPTRYHFEDEELKR